MAGKLKSGRKIVEEDFKNARKNKKIFKENKMMNVMSLRSVR